LEKANQSPQEISVKCDLNFSGLEKSGFSLSVDTAFPSQGVTAIFGQSGSGKTSLLRFIAGLEPDGHGTISMNGNIWQDCKQRLPTHQRPIGYVFQESSLFAHLTAQQNLNYAIKRSAEKHDSDLTARVIDTMGIASILGRRPHQLSGGERQRVAIARALLIRPQLLLMDEPLASLDEARKQEILPYLEALKSQFNLPIVYVSHSMSEIARLADYALVLEAGRVVAEGTLKDVFSRIDKPALTTNNAGVVLQGTVVEVDPTWQLVKIECSGGNLWVAGEENQLHKKVRVQVLARDVSLALSVHEDSSILNRVAVEVVEIAEESHLPVILVRLKLGDDFMVARLTRKSCHQLQLSVGDQVWAQIKSAAIVR
jgi:molybdate transport system ATP-binding protein